MTGMSARGDFVVGLVGTLGLALESLRWYRTTGRPLALAATIGLFGMCTIVAILAVTA
jgi:hypothetical protein